VSYYVDVSLFHEGLCFKLTQDGIVRTRRLRLITAEPSGEVVNGLENRPAPPSVINVSREQCRIKIGTYVGYSGFCRSLPILCSQRYDNVEQSS